VALDPPRAAREAEAVVADPGWATVEEAREARRALRPPHSRDTVDADLAVFLRPGADGRLRLHFSRAAAAAAWGVMAEPPPDLTAYAGEVLLVVAGRVDVVTRALREALARGLGPRLTTAGIDAGHMLIIDAAQEVSALVRDFGSA
jgi:pimeloyl-ACP methyl ester carboxylesterase